MLETQVYICRERACEHYGTMGMAVCSDLGHQAPERFVPITEVDRLRGSLAAILTAPEHAADYARRALNA